MKRQAHASNCNMSHRADIKDHLKHSVCRPKVTGEAIFAESVGDKTCGDDIH